VGQPAVGVNGSAAYIMCHGYWCYAGWHRLEGDGRTRRRRCASIQLCFTSTFTCRIAPPKKYGGV
jgi:hypothetical protein